LPADSQKNLQANLSNVTIYPMKNTTFNPGDTIRVYIKDPHDNKVHATPFEGVVIALRGDKTNRTFTVKKNTAGGIFVERIFPLNSPLIEKISLVKKGNPRRAKLYYLRKKTS